MTILSLSQSNDSKVRNFRDYLYTHWGVVRPQQPECLLGGKRAHVQQFMRQLAEFPDVRLPYIHVGDAFGVLLLHLHTRHAREFQHAGGFSMQRFA